MSDGITTRSESPDVPFLDELIASGDLWSDRDQEAEAIAQHLLKSTCAIVVLHGPRRSGKTELLRRRVAPLVSQHRRVRFRGDADAAAAIADADAIEIWDSFESSLADENAGRDDVIKEVARALDAPSPATTPCCRMVLVIADDALNRLFQLCAAIPQVVEDIAEIPRIAPRALFERFTHATTRYGVRTADSFLAALDADLTAGNASASSELAAILVFEICRLKPPGDTATGEYYESRGGLAGILEAHLNWLLERLPNGLDSQIGWTVIEEIGRRGTTTSSLDLAEIANRFDVAADIPAQALHWLEDVRHVVQQRGNGDYDLVPPQLALAADAKQRRDTIDEEHYRWVLRQAVRHFVEAEALLSEQSFSRIHAHRTALRVSDDEAKLMLRCALAYEDPTVDGATRYWLRRVKDPDVQLDVLLEAVFDSRPDVRRRAASHLGAFHRPDVRNQLHLLALRDPSDAVRAQAIESLDAIKDEDLLKSLIQELHDTNSPYRLQAIDALRIFDAPDAIAALLHIVVRPCEGDADRIARHRAIDVLGRHETAEGAAALIEVARHDPDEEDRAAAARVLGSMRSPETLRYLLDRLRELRTEATAWHVSLSWRSSAVWFAYAVVASAAALGTLLVNGLLLLTMRRWRLGLLVSAIGGAALVIGYSWASGLAIVVFVGTLLFGFLAPFRILMLERQAGTPAGWYRRSLGAVVFASCLPIFLYFHGLPYMLTRRIRRGLVLMAFEGLGILLLVGAAYIETEFSAFNGISPIFDQVWWSFVAIALVVLGSTFLTGLGVVWFDAFVLQNRRECLHRIDAIHTALSANRAVPLLLLNDCASAAPGKARWGRRMLRAFPPQAGGGLRASWDSADAPTRRRIFTIVARRHDPETMDFLRVAARSLDWRARVEYLWASLAFRIGVWPKPVLVAIATVMYVQVAAVVVLYTHFANEPGRLESIAGGRTTSLRDRRHAIDDLQTLAEQRRDHAVANAAASSVANIVSLREFPEEDAQLRDAVLKTVAAVAPTSEERQSLVAAVGRLLALPDLQAAAVETLTKIGGPEADRQLKEFIELPLSAARSADDELLIRRRAIDALARFKDPDAIEALNALATSQRLRPDLKMAVDTALASDPLIQAESFLANRQYEAAIDPARNVIESSPNMDRMSRARQVLSRVYTIEGQDAFDHRRFSDAKALLLAAIDQLDPAVAAVNRSDLQTLGLNLEFEYHERTALTDASAYDDAYDILAKLAPIKGDPTFTIAVQAGLAEANLTTGRYTNALDVANRLIGRSDVDRVTEINMAFIAYASLLLNHQPAAAARQDLLAAYQKLPKGSKNDWSWAGTRNYIQRTAISDADRAQLLGTLSQVESSR